MQRSNRSAQHQALLSDDQDHLAVLMLGLSLNNDIIEATGLAIAASKEVLAKMFRKDRVATEAYYHRLLEKCRELDSRSEPTTDMDLASQQAWARYCKECINLAVLRSILFQEPVKYQNCAGTMVKRNIEGMIQQISETVVPHGTYGLRLDDIVGRPKVLKFTGEELLDTFDSIHRSTPEMQSTRQVVLEYYRLTRHCRELDKTVDDSWIHRPSKFKEWKQFCRNCQLALIYYSILHVKAPKLLERKLLHEGDGIDGNGSREAWEDEGQIMAAPTETLQTRDKGTESWPTYYKRDFIIPALYSSSAEAPGTLSIALNNMLLQYDEPPSRGSPTLVTDTSGRCYDSTPGTSYLCLVRDKLVYVADEASMDLAGKDSKKWKPQPPNIILCHAPPSFQIVVNLSRVLPHQWALFHGNIRDVTAIYDMTYETFLSHKKRNSAINLHDLYVETISETDMKQLENQIEVGIPGASAKKALFVRQCMDLMWLRQFLYGKPFQVLIPPEMRNDVLPHFLKHGITIRKVADRDDRANQV